MSIKLKNVELSYRILYKKIGKIDPVGKAVEVDKTKLSAIPQWREKLTSCLPDAFESCDRLVVTCEYYWWQVRIINLFSSFHNLICLYITIQI